VTLDLTLPAKIGPDRGFKLPKKRKGGKKKKGDDQDDDDDDDEEDDEDEEDDRFKEDTPQSPSQAQQDEENDSQGGDSDGDEVMKMFRRDWKITKDADGREIRTMWTNPGIGHGPGQGLGKPKRKRGGGTILAIEDDEEVETSEPPLEKPTSLQISGLHTKTPLVSYGGSIFQCSWAQNMGTEFLFTERDIDDPLPVIKQLPDEVDLVAASSVRILSKRIAQAPIPMEERIGMRPDFMKHEKVIPKNVAYSSSRKRAVPFLERLANIKRVRGEADQVSILARSTDALKDKSWLKLLEKKRKEEKERLERGIETGTDGPEIEAAKLRLHEIESDVLTMPPEKVKHDPKPKSTPKPKSKPKQKTKPQPSGKKKGRPRKTDVLQRNSEAGGSIVAGDSERQEKFNSGSDATFGNDKESPGLGFGDGGSEDEDVLDKVALYDDDPDDENGQYGEGEYEDEDAPYEEDYDAPFELDDFPVPEFDEQ